MLGDEDWVPAHRRLLAVVQRMGGREPPLDEVAAMGEDGVEPLRPQIVELALPQPETASEGGMREPREDFVQLPHRKLPGVDEDDLGLGDRDDLDPLLTRDRHPVARLGADAIHLDRAVHRYEIDVARGVEPQLGFLARL